jgi:uncharacterized membrane protein
MKKQANNTQKIVFILLTVIAVITILNFFSFGFIFHFAFGATGLSQVGFCFASLLVGSISWALCEEFNNEYKF